MFVKTEGMSFEKENIFVTDFGPEKSDMEKPSKEESRVRFLSSKYDEGRASSPTSQSSWSFIRKLFRENKNGFSKSIDSPASSPHIPRKLRRSSLGDKGIATKTTHDITTTNNCKKENMNNSSGKQRKLSFGNSRKFSGQHSTENLLHYAVAEKDMNTLHKIFDGGKIDVNYMRPPGLSPLHLACVAGHICVIKLLTDNGADIRLKTWSGLTALQITNMFGHFEAAEFLLSKGADCRDIQNGVADTKLIIVK